MEDFVYLDNSSTTAPCKTAIKYINEALTTDWGNPSSLHSFGFNAERRITAARKAAAKMIGAREDEIYFTSCGTEGDNLAIISAARANKRKGNKIVTSSVEHPAVLNTVKRLCEEGFEAVYLKPDKSGKITKEQLTEAIDGKTILVSLMLVNNETGAIMPVSEIKAVAKLNNSPCLIHTDCVQAFGKMPIDVNRLGVDLLTVSGHKIHGPKGIGFQYIKKGVNIKPIITGGGQEKGMRSGTESVPLISGLFGAIEELPDIKTQLEKMRELRDYTQKRLAEELPIAVNSPEDALPYILNISLPGYRSETLLHFLEAQGVYVSSGSACAKGKGSFVLNEMGLCRERIDSALRISFSRYNTKDDAEKLVSALKSAADKLRKAN